MSQSAVIAPQINSSMLRLHRPLTPCLSLSVSLYVCYSMPWSLSLILSFIFCLPAIHHILSRTFLSLVSFPHTHLLNSLLCDNFCHSSPYLSSGFFFSPSHPLPAHSFTLDLSRHPHPHPLCLYIRLSLSECLSPPPFLPITFSFNQKGFGRSAEDWINKDDIHQRGAKRLKDTGTYKVNSQEK